MADTVTGRYLDALGLAAADPGAEFLGEMIVRHLATFPFTSIGPRLGDDLPLDLESVFDRIVTRRRGGYCFEHNSLFFHVLGELGYQRRLVLARVVIRTDDPPLDHRTTLVTLPEGDMLADVGFGWQTPIVPVPMSGEEVGSGHRRFRVTEVGARGWESQVLTDEGWVSRYRFDLHPYGDIDCEVGHFYCSRNPQMPFVNTLIASLVVGDEMRSLRDGEYQVISPTGTAVTRLEDSAHLRALLADELGARITTAESEALWRDIEAKRASQEAG